MATSPAHREWKRGAAAALPPKRGRIKAQIFESLAENVSHVASKAGEALSNLRRSGGGGGTSDSSASTSTAASPHHSAYGSDGSVDPA